MISFASLPSTIPICVVDGAAEVHVNRLRSALWMLVVGSVLLACGQSPPSQHLLGTPDDWSLGPSSASVVLVEYGDYQCPPCVALHQAVTAMMAKHGSEVRFIFRHYPTRRHRNAERAAEAAEAAGAQGKFWQMHAQLYEHQSEWYGLADPMPAFTRYAQAIGLDVARFRDDAGSKRFREKIRKSKEEAQALGVRGAPALFLNGERLLRLPLKIEDLETQIADALRRPRGR